MEQPGGMTIFMLTGVSVCGFGRKMHGAFGTCFYEFVLVSERPSKTCAYEFEFELIASYLFRLSMPLNPFLLFLILHFEQLRYDALARKYINQIQDYYDKDRS